MDGLLTHNLWNAVFFSHQEGEIEHFGSPKCVLQRSPRGNTRMISWALDYFPMVMTGTRY